jgi:hypothetical protein
MDATFRTFATIAVLIPNPAAAYNPTDYSDCLPRHTQLAAKACDTRWTMNFKPEC